MTYKDFLTTLTTYNSSKSKKYQVPINYYHESKSIVLEFSASLSSLVVGMLCELAWEHQLDSSLDRFGSNCLSFRGSGEGRGFRWESLKNISHEVVHDVHGSLGDSNFWVNLFEHLIYVDRIGLFILSPSSVWLIVSTIGWSSSWHLT